jgi:hypothetical protein
LRLGNLGAPDAVDLRLAAYLERVNVPSEYHDFRVTGRWVSARDTDEKSDCYAGRILVVKVTYEYRDWAWEVGRGDYLTDQSEVPLMLRNDSFEDIIVYDFVEQFSCIESEVERPCSFAELATTEGFPRVTTCHGEEAYLFHEDVVNPKEI